MNNISGLIDCYNENLYLSILRILIERLSDIELFLNSIRSDSNIQNIDELTRYYQNVFTNALVAEHIEFKIDRIPTSLFFRMPKHFNKGNSYFHLTLKLKSDEIKGLDKLYQELLSRLIKLYKHLFSKIDNYFISFDNQQLIKYEKKLDEIKREITKFIEFAENREIIEKREKLKEQYLKQIPFGGLFYTTHIGNLKGILEFGILSHNLAFKKGLVAVDISNNEVNARRNRIEPTLGGNIHDFTPLYFNPKNPMLYYLCKHSQRDDLILLKVTPHILLLENVAFSDGNAAVKTTRFYHNIDEFNKINWTVINDKYWADYPDGKRIRCSEVLVNEKIPLYFVDDIFVYSETALDKVVQLYPNHCGIKTSINKSLYF